MNGNPHEEVNNIRKIVHEGQLGKYQEKDLKRMLVVLEHYQAGQQYQMSADMIDPVKTEIALRQKERHHEENLEEIEGIRASQENAAKEAAKKSDDRHREAMGQNLELHHKTQKVAWIAVLMAAAGFVAAVLIAVLQHFENKAVSTRQHNDQPLEHQPSK